MISSRTSGRPRPVSLETREACNRVAIDGKMFVPGMQSDTIDLYGARYRSDLNMLPLRNRITKSHASRPRPRRRGNVNPGRFVKRHLEYKQNRIVT